jgi:hypothetical protein
LQFEEGQMTKNTLKPVAAAISSSVVMAQSVALEADNPFAMVEFGDAFVVAAE